jgi:enoyl-CoA hydratase
MCAKIGGMGAPKKADWREERRKRAWKLKEAGWRQKTLNSTVVYHPYLVRSHMPENYQFILVDRDERVGIVTLNRPNVLNALNNHVVSELADALAEFDRDDEIRCMVITGAGEKAFAAGADIKEMSGKSPIDMMLGGFEAWQRIRQIHKPLIAAVGGYALGGGCELAMHCDMIVASENARFGQPEILLGIIPGAGGTQRLARTIGKFRTMEMVLTGAQIPAQELADLGLVNRVVPKGEHLTEAVKLAKTVAAQAPIAVRLAKEAVQAAFETSLSEGLELERKNFFLLFASEDMREGMRAFIEKRKADFQGR